MTTATLPPVPNIEPPPLPGGLALPRLWERWIAGNKVWYRAVEIPWTAESKFLAYIKENKLVLLQRGFAYRKADGKHSLFQWLAGTPGAYTLTPDGANTLAAAMAPQLRTQELALAAAEPELSELPGGLEKLLYGYQVDPARQLFRSLRRGNQEWGYPGAVDFSGVGLGKTFMDLAAMLATGKKVGVICPPVGRPGWEAAFQLFGAEPYFIQTYEGLRGGWRPNICTPTAEGGFHWKNPGEIGVILDEAQAMRHDGSLTFRAMAGAMRQKIPLIVASATIAISPLEFRFPGRVVGLHDGGTDWDRFLRQHGCAQKTKGGPWTWDQDKRHLRAINARLFPMRGCRVRPEDLGDACPETEIAPLPFTVPEGPEIERMWLDSLETIARLGRQGTPESVLMGMRARARMATWQRCEEVLVPHLVRRIKQDFAEDRSVAIFTNFTNTRLALQKALNAKEGLYGGISPTQRKSYIEAFQADRIRVLVNQIKAGGASVSLHDVRGQYARTAYIFPGDNPISVAQGIGRVNRVGSKSKSYQWFPHIAGGMTERMVHSMRKKIEQLDSINDGYAEARF